jgi:hypothetical protein
LILNIFIPIFNFGDIEIKNLRRLKWLTKQIIQLMIIIKEKGGMMAILPGAFTEWLL